jgi:hypothetical protein
MTAGLAMAWGFLMGAAWHSWMEQNRRARRMPWSMDNVRSINDRKVKR